ncbi:hypothetical protein, conserved [Eimeria necatrix]|uniref:Uncharacterized protein n=1 Tax=Eimeria necatrix TaxID=51315 RepID=U6MEJ5_9EIME|nr:hypothetical protein, conserved [Eimeria necatrix]CDJ62647.1 hypothetical protein, conserved [Eimeria necatrix]
MERLDAILSRKTGLCCTMFPTETLAVEKLEHLVVKETQSGEKSIRSACTSTCRGPPCTHPRHASHAEGIEKLVYTEAAPPTQNWRASQNSCCRGEVAPSWLYFREGTETRQQGLKAMRSSELSAINRKGHREKRLSSSKCIELNSRIKAYSTRLPPQQQQEQAALGMMQSTASIPSVGLNPSEEASSSLVRMEVSGTQVQTKLQQPECKIFQMSCLSKLCSERKQERIDGKTDSSFVDTTEGKIPVAEIVTSGSSTHSTEASACTASYQPGQGVLEYSCASATASTCGAVNQRSFGGSRAWQWRPGVTTLQAQCSSLHGASLRKRHSPVGYSNQQSPVQIILVDGQLPQQQVPQQWAAQWQQWPQRWHSPQHLPFQELAVKHVQMQRQAAGIGCIGYPHIVCMLPQYMPKSWVSVVVPTPHFWSRWEGEGQLEELFAGQPGALLPTVKKSVHDECTRHPFYP